MPLITKTQRVMVIYVLCRLFFSWEVVLSAEEERIEIIFVKSDTRSEVQATFPTIDSVIQQYTNKSEGVITSGNDGKHKADSLHYQDRAIDIRGNDIPDEVMRKIAEELQQQLGPDYDIIPEVFPHDPSRDHIHIEYDPQRPAGGRSGCP